jgi:hypothetical protein
MEDIEDMFKNDDTGESTNQRLIKSKIAIRKNAKKAQVQS